MMVGVDEARHHDAVGAVHHHGVADRNVWANFTDLAVLDQHVGVGEVADRRVQASAPRRP